MKGILIKTLTPGKISAILLDYTISCFHCVW